MKTIAVLVMTLFCAVYSRAEEPTVSAVQDSKAIREMVEAYWREEVECPFPQYKMTRAVWGIDGEGKFSTEEKSTLIFKAKELRKEMSTAIRETKWAKKAKTGQEIKARRLGFPKTERGRQAIERLKDALISPEALVDYLAENSDGMARGVSGETIRSDEDVRAMSTAAKARHLATVMAARRADREERARQQKELCRSNEQGKPPVLPFRATPEKSKTRKPSLNLKKK